MSDQDEPKEPESHIPEPVAPEPVAPQPAATEPQTTEPAPAPPVAAAPAAVAPGATAAAPGWPAPPPGPVRERPSRRTLLITMAVMAGVILFLLLTTAFALGRHGHADRFGRGPMMGRVPGGCIQGRSFPQTTQAAATVTPTTVPGIPVPPSGAPRFPFGGGGSYGHFRGGCGMFPGGWSG